MFPPTICGSVSCYVQLAGLTEIIYIVFYLHVSILMLINLPSFKPILASCLNLKGLILNKRFICKSSDRPVVNITTDTVFSGPLQPASVECIVQAEPEPELTWYHNNSELTAENQRRRNIRRGGSVDRSGPCTVLSSRRCILIFFSFWLLHTYSSFPATFAHWSLV